MRACADESGETLVIGNIGIRVGDGATRIALRDVEVDGTSGTAVFLGCVRMHVSLVFLAACTQRWC